MTHPIIEHIAAGQLKTAKQSSQVFQAYLGTCLGVALYDRANKIGGLIHILLPEPPGFSGADDPQKYASTGIPLLIRDLVALGACLENLRASIAGGALVGPVSEQDMGLDIGGRSADIVRAILGGHGIKVIKSETGGFFTCTLELDMATGKTRIRPAWEQFNQTAPRFTPPRKEDIKATIDQLKAIPQNALRILRMFQANCYNIKEITHELAQDQVLSAKTLKLCNSAFFAGTLKIDSLSDAVMLLGQEMLIKSVITAAVNTYYSQTGTSGYSLVRGGLFFHAVGVAATAEKLAERTGRVQGKHAYTAGLLHDIGRVVLDQYIADSSPLLFREMGNADTSFTRTEKKLLGITHCEAGFILARKWKFSNALVQVIRHHHHPEQAKECRDLVAVVYLADLLMERFHTGLDLEKMQTRSMKAVMDRLDLKLADIPELIDTLPLTAITQRL